MRAPVLILLAALLGASACQSARLPDRLDRLSYEGNESFPVQELSGVVTREFLGSETAELTPTAVDDAAFALELFYRRQGYADVVVDYELDPEAKGGPTARFVVSEGPRRTITSLRIEGNQAYGNDELSALVPDLLPEQPWVESRVSGGAASIGALYYGAGFLEARTQGRTELAADTGAITVVLAIQEGPRFRVTDVVLAGDRGGSDEALGRIERRYEGQTYTPRLGYEIRAALVDVFGKAGHPEADAPFDAKVDRTTGDVVLTYRLDPREEVRIRGLVMEGNENTDSKFIEKRLGLELGKPWNSDDIRAAFRSLWSTGLFKTVELELAQQEGTDRDLRVHVEEAPSLELYAEPGWGSYEGPRVRLGIDERNLFGTARRGFFETSVSPKAQSAELGLEDPWFLGSSLRAESSLFGNHREEPSYTYEELGARFSLRKSWTQTRFSTFGYEFRLTRIPEADVEGELPPEALDDVDVASLRAALVRDTRDNPLIPRAGGRQRIQLEWASTALGSQVEFGAVDVDVNRTFSFGHTVFACSAKAGVTAPYGVTDVLPIQERRFNGGENRVRAFREDQLGPLDAQGDPVGGEAYTIVSAELRRPIVGNLESAFFFDAGNVVPQAGDFFDFPDFRTGLGVGVRYLLPIGPLRVDLGYNPSTRDGEDELVLHFAVGLPY